MLMSIPLPPSFNCCAIPLLSQSLKCTVRDMHSYLFEQGALKRRGHYSDQSMAILACVIGQQEKYQGPAVHPIRITEFRSPWSVYCVPLCMLVSSFPTSQMYPTSIALDHHMKDTTFLLVVHFEATTAY